MIGQALQFQRKTVDHAAAWNSQTMQENLPKEIWKL